MYNMRDPTVNAKKTNRMLSTLLPDMELVGACSQALKLPPRQPANDIP